MSNSVQQFIGGLNTDVDILNIKSNEYTYALNAILESTTGDFGSLTNELGTVDLTEIKQIKNCKIIGHSIIEKDICLFIEGLCSISNQKISEIGVIEHNDNGGKYRSYIRTGGNNNIVNANELYRLYDHSSTQLPIQTEKDYLNFNNQFQINTTSKILNNKHRIVYYTDDFNKPRKIDLDDLDSLKLSKDFIYQVDSELQENLFYNYTNIFLENYKIPELRNFTITNNGRLPSSVYQFLFKYKNKNQNTADFVTSSVLIPINDDPEGSLSIDYDGCEPMTPTNKGIRLLIDNLDPSYDSIELYVVYKEGLASSFKSGLVDTIYYKTTSIEYSFNTLNQLKTTIDSRSILLTNNAFYVKAKCVEQNNNRLLFSNLETTETNDALFQRIANSIELSYEIEDINYIDDFNIVINNDQGIGGFNIPAQGIIQIESNGRTNLQQFTKNPNFSASKVTYKRGEVYDFAFIPIINGRIGKAYHIPAFDYNLSQSNIDDMNNIAIDDRFLKRYKQDDTNKLGCFYSGIDYPDGYGYPRYIGLTKRPQRFHVIPDNQKNAILQNYFGSPYAYIDNINNNIQYLSIKSEIKNINPFDDSNIIENGLDIFNQLILDKKIDGYYIGRQERNSFNNRIILAQGLSINLKTHRENYSNFPGWRNPAHSSYNERFVYTYIHTPLFNNFITIGMFDDDGGNGRNPPDTPNQGGQPNNVYIGSSELANCSMFYAPDFIHKITDQIGLGSRLKYIGEHQIAGGQIKKPDDSFDTNTYSNRVNRYDEYFGIRRIYCGAVNNLLQFNSGTYLKQGYESMIFPYYIGGNSSWGMYDNIGLNNYLNSPTGSHGYLKKVAAFGFSSYNSNRIGFGVDNRKSSNIFLNMSNFKRLIQDYVFNSNDYDDKFLYISDKKRYGKDYLQITRAKYFDKTLIDQDYTDSTIKGHDNNHIELNLNCTSGIFYSHKPNEHINTPFKYTNPFSNGTDPTIENFNINYIKMSFQYRNETNYPMGVTITDNFSTPVYEAINENENVYGNVLNAEYLICNYIDTFNNLKPNIYQAITTPIQNKIYGGDTYMVKYGLNLQTLILCDQERNIYNNEGIDPDNPNDLAGRWRQFGALHYAWYECSANLNLRHRAKDGWKYFPKNKVISKMLMNNQPFGTDFGILLQPQEVKGHSTAYNKQYDDSNNLITTFSNNSLANDNNNDLSNRTIYSELSFEGEKKDSYQEFKINNFKDIPKNKGEIWNTMVLDNDLYCQTPYTTWKMFMQPQTTQSTSLGEVILGNASLFSLIPKEIMTLTGGYGGSSSQYGGFNTPIGYLFLDGSQKKVFKLTNQLEEITENISKELFNFQLKNVNLNYQLKEKIDNNIFDNPVNFKGVLSTFDYRNNRFLMTLHQNKDISKTFSYSTKTNNWISEHSYKPTTYISNANRLLISRDNDDVLSNKREIFEFQGNAGVFYDNINDTINVPNNNLGKKVQYGKYMYNTIPNTFEIEFICNSGQGVNTTSGNPYTISSLDTKIFDNLIIKTTEKDLLNNYRDANNLAKLYQTFDAIICSNSYQYNEKQLITDNTDFGFENINPNEHLVKYKNNEFKLSIIRDNTEDEARFRDKFIRIRLIYNNDHYLSTGLTEENRKIVLSTIQVMFRENER